MLAPLFEDAGLPKGVLQVLNFSETDVVDRIEQLVAHPKIRVSTPSRCEAGMPLAQSSEHLLIRADGQFHRIDQDWSGYGQGLRSASQVRTETQSVSIMLIRRRPSVLELGGKAAVIVLPSADLKIAANNVGPMIGMPSRRLNSLGAVRCLGQLWSNLHVD